MVGGFWYGYLFGRVRGQPVPCWFCGAPDNAGHLFGECTFPPLVEIRENPEFHDLVRMDKGHWPRCLLWHGWLPLLSGVNGASPWAADASEGAGNLLELGRDWPVQSKTNKKRVLMKLEESSSSVRRETYRSVKPKDFARALAKLSPGGMSEFVQSVPVNVAGSLMRFAAQSVPLRLWPTELDSQNEASTRSGPAAIESCG